MRIVADTNTFLAVAMDEPEKHRLLAVTRGVELAAPSVLPYEVGNALSALVKRKRLTAEQADRAWGVVRRIPVELIEVDVSASIVMASAHGIYAYDAYFLQCAVSLGCPLLTLDRAMARLGAGLRIPILEIS
jgi:predicted nucleic acid-binding protein